MPSISKEKLKKMSRNWLGKIHKNKHPIRMKNTFWSPFTEGVDFIYYNLAIEPCYLQNLKTDVFWFCLYSYTIIWQKSTISLVTKKYSRLQHAVRKVIHEKLHAFPTLYVWVQNGGILVWTKLRSGTNSLPNDKWN